MAKSRARDRCGRNTYSPPLAAQQRLQGRGASSVDLHGLAASGLTPNDPYRGAPYAERAGQRVDHRGVRGAVDGRRGDRDPQPVADRGPDRDARRARHDLDVDEQRRRQLSGTSQRSCDAGKSRSSVN